MFRRKFVFQDEQEKWYDDNGIRSIFFCKGALETVKKFGWPPDIIHCSGWMTGLIPMFLKTAYKKEPVFSNSKVVFTIGENTFTETLGKEFIKQSVISTLIKEKDLEPYKSSDNTGMFNGGATYADAISFGDGQVQKKLIDSFLRSKAKKSFLISQTLI